MKLTSFAFAVVFSASSALGADFSQFIGGHYGDLRDTLVFNGWSPSPISEDSDCYNRREVPECAAFPEIQTCAGTGLAACIMSWTRDGEIMQIRVAGETPKLVTSVGD